MILLPTQVVGLITAPQSLAGPSALVSDLTNTPSLIT